MIQRKKEVEAGYSVVNDKTFIEEFDYEIAKTVATDCGVKDMPSRCRLKLCEKIVEADMEARRGPRSRKQTCRQCLTKHNNAFLKKFYYHQILPFFCSQILLSELSEFFTLQSNH